jgi:hypothetical protein
MMIRPITVASLCLLSIFILMTACSQDNRTALNHKSALEENDMTLQHDLPAAAGQIPPIDAAAPTAIETASFGLG